MDADRPVEDAEIDEIVSPLASNTRLRALIERFERRGEELRSGDLHGGDASELHYAEVDRVADNLAWRDHEGKLDQWDWAATFLTDESFRNLYDSDRHWMFEDFIREDVTEFLEGDWENYARSRMTKREQANLRAILAHFPSEDWDDVILRLERLLEE